MTKGLILALAVLMCGIIQSSIAQDRFPEALPGRWMNIDLQARCLPVSTLRSAPNPIRPFVGIDGEGDLWFSETDPQTRAWTSNSRDHTAVREMIQEAVSRADMRFENGMETFERKETIRPFKRAVYWIYGLFTTSILSAVVAWVTGKA
jgi:hypothetical protein